MSKAKEHHAEIERLTRVAKDRNTEIERLTRDAEDRDAGSTIADEATGHAAEIERLTTKQEPQRRDRTAHGDVAGCDAEIERLRHENEHLRAQAGRFATRLRREPGPAGRTETSAPEASSHLVFVQLGGGYELVESDGPPPPLHTLLELPEFSETEFVVTRLGHSPLPADERSCIFVQRV